MKKGSNICKCFSTLDLKNPDKKVGSGIFFFCFSFNFLLNALDNFD